MSTKKNRPLNDRPGFNNLLRVNASVPDPKVFTESVNSVSDTVPINNSYTSGEITITVDNIKYTLFPGPSNVATITGFVNQSNPILVVIPQVFRMATAPYIMLHP